MNHRLMKRDNRAPTLSDLDVSWQDQDPSRDQPLRFDQPARRHSRLRAWLPWLISALLLAGQILERKQDWLESLRLPALPAPATAATALKPPTPFVRQQFRTVRQEIDYKQQMIRTARHAIDISERDIERYTFDLSVALATLDKLKAEYDWRTIEAEYRP